MFEKIKKLLFAKKEIKIMLSEDELKEVLSKVIDEYRLKEFSENMLKFDYGLNINFTSVEDKAVNKFWEDVHNKERLERKVRMQEREIMAAMQPSTYNRQEVIRLIDFQPELHKAASCRDVSDIYKVELLLKNGANPNKRSSSGNTPLHEAILIENLPAITLLLVYGANLFIKNEEGKTPYDLSLGKTLVEDLFSSNKEISAKVRIQVLNNNLEKLYNKQGMSKLIGHKNTYKVKEGVNDIAMKKGQPVSSLKELCIQKILDCVEIM